jgi:uncharacterized protein DUF4157
MLHAAVHSADHSVPSHQQESGARGTESSLLAGLQKTRGNQAVLRMLRAAGGKPMQAKCDCGGSGPTCGPCEEKREPMQRSALSDAVPRTGDVPEIASSSAVTMPAAMRARAESAFGSSFRDVRLHADPAAATAAARVAARAFTVDDDIYFGAGWYRPETPDGAQLLGHELAHVIQQRNGLASSDLEGPHDRYEQEADAAGAAFARGEPIRISGGGGSERGRAQFSIERAASDASAVAPRAPKVSRPSDPAEREAAQTADRVAAAGSIAVVEKDSAGEAARPLPAATRSVMEHRFSADFSRVRIHTDSRASDLAASLHANAFTVGSDIYFGAFRFAPDTPAGVRLLAHELAHTLQRGRDGEILRDCDDPNFCKPYGSYQEVILAQQLLRAAYLPLDEAKFGANSRSLFERFLSRRRGDSLTPVVFEDPASDVVQSFADSWTTSDDQDEIIDMVGERLDRAGQLQPDVDTTMSLANFLPPYILDNRPMNFSNPLSIAGHIAGGIGSSDAGPDRRSIAYGNVMLTKTPLLGSAGYVRVETFLNYEVRDAVDFCPGDCGSPAEQWITIPMSRLEATGEAYDVPFVVRFVPESRSKRFWYS